VKDSSTIDADNTALAPTAAAPSPSPANVWEKGMTSPNPKGRKPLPVEIKRAWQAAHPEAVAKLVAIMNARSRRRLMSSAA
jgi:hypothetical protein